MKRHIYISVALILGLCITLHSILFAAKETIPNSQPGMMALSQAVEQFNKRAMKNHIGKEQPALTVDEVVACIRSWNRDLHPVTNEILARYQRIAETKMLPNDASIRFNTRLTSDPYYFDVWWIDLQLTISEEPDGRKTIYVYRLRNRKIRSRLLAEAERNRIKPKPPSEEIRRMLDSLKKKAREDGNRSGLH